MKAKLAWVVPFNFLVIALLASRGLAPVRLAILAVSLFASTVLVKLRVRQLARRVDHGSSTLLLSCFLYFVGIGVTGGIESPLLITAVPMIVSAALQPLGERLRFAFFGIFASGLVILALAAHTSFVGIPSPLVADVSFSSKEYVVIATGAFLLSLSSLYFMGPGVTHVYERIAIELAERREEICSESEDRTRALEGIAARLAHEVKNPLAAIKGLSTHMSRNADDPRVAERLAIVAGEADRLQAIVDGFLSFSRGLDDLQLGPVVPHALARELELLLETRAADVGVKLEVKGSEELVLNADGRKLRQAMLNLVLNAMQASPAGETVTMEVAKCCGGAACVKVIDRGQGMSPEVLERIRRPYYTTREGGTGLGVAIARGLIEQHGGRLHFESRAGKGTTVTIDLPACAKLAAAERKLPNPARPADRAAEA